MFDNRIFPRSEREFRTRCSLLLCPLLSLSHLVEPVEIVCRDDVVGVEVEDVEEEVAELVLLELCEEISSGLDRTDLGHVVRETPVDPCGWKRRREILRGSLGFLPLCASSPT